MDVMHEISLISDLRDEIRVVALEGYNEGL